MATTQYTKAEVASRNGKNNAPVWIIYKDGVYDVTKYLNEHPGGYDVLIEEAGTDATTAFEDISHSSDARAIMAKFKIGEIIEEERRFDANGKKKKNVVSVSPSDKPDSRSCLSIVTCGLIA